MPSPLEIMNASFWDSSAKKDQSFNNPFATALVSYGLQAHLYRNTRFWQLVSSFLKRFSSFYERALIGITPATRFPRFTPATRYLYSFRSTSLFLLPMKSRP